MPRRWLITVKDCPQLTFLHWYVVRVRRVAPAGSAAMCVTLEHLAEDQAGRTHSVSLPLPVRPEGLTAEFLRTAGVEVAVGTKIDPTAAVGQMLSVRFQPDGDEYRAVEFRPPD